MDQGADVIVVEKPAVQNQQEFFLLLEKSKIKKIPIFISEHYIFSNAIRKAIQWMSFNLQMPIEIYVELSKDRSKDFETGRGGRNVRLVDIEMPHAVAIHKMICGVAAIDINAYNEIQVIKSQYYIKAEIKYDSLRAFLLTDLSASSQKRVCRIVTHDYKLEISFDTSNVQYVGGERMEILKISRGESVIESFTYSINYLSLLLSEVKQGCQRDADRFNLLLPNFYSDTVLLDKIQNY